MRFFAAHAIDLADVHRADDVAVFGVVTFAVEQFLKQVVARHTLLRKALAGSMRAAKAAG